MAPPTVLLLASSHLLADRITALLRGGGFEVVPGWFDDPRHQAPEGAPVDIVLVDLRHHAARSPAFTRMAAQLGVALAYFDAGGGDDRDLVSELGGADADAPVLPLDDDGQPLVEVLRAMVPNGRRIPPPA